MKVDLFDFELPRERIADRPARPRDAARLLDLTGNGMVDRIVRELPDLLQPGDLLVGNDTRVIPARLDGMRGAAQVEATLHQRVADDAWRAFVKRARRLKTGDRVVFAEDLYAEVGDRQEGGDVLLRFNRSGTALFEALEAYGRMPLPPYIRREKHDPAHASDREDYQTLFARQDGAIAAPTAGLHFTPALLSALEQKGVGLATVTLHVGAGTFRPVSVEDTDDHRMHAEWGCLDQATADRVRATQQHGGRVVAIGTTSLRVLETAALNGELRPFEGLTDLFVVPGFQFRVVDRLLTNFHLPRSTLFMLVCAFAGLDRMRAAYEHAVRQGYRFYSYGDACLLERIRHDDTSGSV